jgi:hypothetical protein
MCVINCATKYLNTESKRDKYFVDEVENLIKRKTTPAQPNTVNPLTEEIAMKIIELLIYQMYAIVCNKISQCGN